MPRIAWDFDDTLADWRAAFYAWMVREGFAPAIALCDSTQFSLEDCWPQLAGALISMRIRAYALTAEFSSIPVLPGAWDAVRETTALGFEAVAITAPGTHPLTVSHRAAQLAPFGFAETHVLGIGAKKVPVARAAGCLLLVDDSPSKITEALAEGLPVVVVDQAYNREFRGLPRVRSWDEDLPVLLEEADCAARAARRAGRLRVA